MVLQTINGCVIIPTYNNERTLARVLTEVLQFTGDRNTIVVNDGATDQTAAILSSFGDRIILLTHESNKGKGFALRTGINEAISRGYDYAITIDSDGQHFPADIHCFVAAVEEYPGNMVMGSRNMEQSGVPGKSSFGNKFSNFWFRVHTGIQLPDTQTGFRAYPLEPLKKIRLHTTRFETEIEIIVKMAWRGVSFRHIPIQVKYDPAERVTHFRPFKDFSRISVLNTWFFIQTLVWYLPKRLFLFLRTKGGLNVIKSELYKPGESIERKAASIAFGLFIGIAPIWGFQLLVGIPAAVALRLNKVLFFLAANISIPPMIPVIIFASYKFGSPFFPEQENKLRDWKDLTLESIHYHFAQYFTGALLLAICAAGAGFAISWVWMRLRSRA